MIEHGPQPFEFAGFTLDRQRRQVAYGETIVAMRPKCFDLLDHLLGRAGAVVTKTELSDRVWPGVVVSDESLARCVSDLRAALRDQGHRIVKTVPGRGYVLAVPVSRRPPPAVAPQQDVTSGMDALPRRHPSIAVLPFQNLDDDPAQDVYADGFTDDIISALSKFKEFVVIARNTTAAYSGAGVDPRRLGREIDVRYVLEGSVRKAGDRLRVNAQLIETEGGSHLWAETFAGRIDDMFGILDDLTQRIVGRLGSELLAAEYARTRRTPTHSLDAWECVVRALHLSSQQSEPTTGSALALLDRALASDPGYVQAIGMKAWLLVFRAFQGWGEMSAALSGATALIAQGLAIDNSALWPYLAHGMVGYALRDNDLSVGALSRAVQLSPSSVNAHGLLGNAHAFGGRSAEALACIARAMRLSPRDTYLSDFELYLAFAHFQSGNHVDGLRFAQQARRIRPGHPYPLILGASCAGHLGRRDVGADMLDELRRVMPIASLHWVEATSPYVLAQDRARLVDGMRRVGLR